MSEQLVQEKAQDVEVSTDINDYVPGTVDNPFLYNASNEQLQQFLLTILFVAGKNAKVQQEKVHKFISIVKRDLGAMTVENMGIFMAIYAATKSDADAKSTITTWLKEARVGQYTRLTAAIQHVGERMAERKLNLRKCKRPNLNGIPGVGYKSASMFLLYTRKNWEGACLDTHILKYLKEVVKMDNVPDSTPQIKAEYERLEAGFIQAIKSVADFSGKTTAEIDFAIWSSYRKKA